MKNEKRIKELLCEKDNLEQNIDSWNISKDYLDSVICLKPQKKITSTSFLDKYPVSISVIPFEKMKKVMITLMNTRIEEINQELEKL